jgi:ABC-type nitrate/sulfonate/bicarbonate transport system ATPase subunit
MSKIILKNVGRVFTDAEGRQVEALRDVNLSVDDEFDPAGKDIGEFRVILGPSGCGKSTILRLIAGLDFPTSGEVLVNGKRVEKPGPDRGMVFQKYTSFSWLTVAQNIEYGLKLKGVAESERKDIVAHLVQATGLAGFESAYPHTLSGGMQQRVAIARSIAVRPSVLLMDEPFGALDAQTRSGMQDLLMKIWTESAATILFVTHDVGEAVYLADRMYVVSARPGTIVDEIHVPAPRPRTEDFKTDRSFQDLQNRALESLRHAASNAGGQVRMSL